MNKQGRSNKFSGVGWAICLVLAVLAACSTPASTPDPEAVYTAAAGTLQSQLNAALTETQIVYWTEEAGLLTKAVTPSATITDTLAIAEPPTIMVSLETNCRSGPDGVYHTVRVLQPNEIHEVIGRSENGAWLVLEAEEADEEICWVLHSDEIVLTGSLFSVPFFAAPPAPTATLGPTPEIGYGFFYVGTRICQGIGRQAQFVIRNTGPVEFVSGRLTIRDPATDTILSDSSSNSPFLISQGDCPPGVSPFPPGATMYLSGGTGNASHGDNLSARAILCTEKGLRGTCINSPISFTLLFD